MSVFNSKRGFLFNYSPSNNEREESSEKVVTKIFNLKIVTWKHAYKVLTLCLLKRMVTKTGWFLSDWQAGFGFRSARGCRDNVLLLCLLYDHIIEKKGHCVVTYIDFAAAFDSVSHKFLDES